GGWSADRLRSPPDKHQKPQPRPPESESPSRYPPRSFLNPGRMGKPGQDCQGKEAACLLAALSFTTGGGDHAPAHTPRVSTTTRARSSAFGMRLNSLWSTSSTTISASAIASSSAARQRLEVVASSAGSSSIFGSTARISKPVLASSLTI